jgi:hypothetical protein
VPFGIDHENEGGRGVPFDPCWVCRMKLGGNEAPRCEGGTDVRTKIVSGSCFAQRVRMYLKTMRQVSPEGFERASSCLNSPLMI